MQETMRGDVNVAAARAKLMGVELWGQKFPMMGERGFVDFVGELSSVTNGWNVGQI